MTETPEQLLKIAEEKRRSVPDLEAGSPPALRGSEGPGQPLRIAVGKPDTSLYLESGPSTSLAERIIQYLENEAKKRGGTFGS